MADDQFKKWLDYGENYSKMNPKAMAGLSSVKPLFDLFTPEASKQKNKKGHKKE
jgi:hypothetical protein